MPQYLSPGVYVEEVDAGPKPIEGVSTSVAGAVGVTARGPDSGKPVLITSFADYIRVFGGPIDVDDTVKAAWSHDLEKGEFWTFHLAVRGFFDNGGQQLYVKRVLAKTAMPAKASLGAGVMAFITKNQLVGDTTLKLESLIGITSNQAIKVYIDGTAKPFTIASFDRSSSTITLSTPLADRIQAGRDFVEVMVKATATPLIVQATSAGAWGDDLQVRVQPMDAGAFGVMADPTLANNAPASTTISADITDNTFSVASNAGFFVGDWITVNGDQYKVKLVPAGKITVELALPAWQVGWQVTNGLAPGGVPATVIDATTAPDKITVHDATGFPGATPFNVLINGDPFRVTAANLNVFTVERVEKWSKGWTVNKVRLAAAVTTQTPSLFVWNASSLYKNGFIEIEDVAGNKKYTGSITAILNNKVTLQLDTAPAAFPILEGARLHLIEGRFDVQYNPSNGPAVSEQITNVRFASDDPQDSRLVQFAIASDSQLISVPVATTIASLADFPLAVDNPGGAPPTTLRWSKLAGGDDNFGALDPDAFVGLDLGPGHRSGIQALEDIDDISITMAPSMWSSLVQNALIQQAELLKYRFAILDPRPVKPTDIDVIDEIRTFRSGFDTKYAALYFPRIEVRDPFIDKTIGLGPSAHMAGIYARVDIERGVHKAPANEVIQGIDTANGFHGLETEITKREQDLLNPIGINALRFFPNRGTRVWGARTLSSDGSWKYINVRRIFIFVERSIDVGTQWVVFEPNDEKTWARVRQSITNFLTTVWRSGALFGSKAEEAFFVRCDRTTMTQDDIDNGRLICVIGIAPVKPAEFVIFRIQQKLIDQTQP
jgi:phage tail sheath protein FI